MAIDTFIIVYRVLVLFQLSASVILWDPGAINTSQRTYIRSDTVALQTIPSRSSGRARKGVQNARSAILLGRICFP
jgi:hypothetical protein